MELFSSSKRSFLWRLLRNQGTRKVQDVPPEPAVASSISNDDDDEPIQFMSAGSACSTSPSSMAFIVPCSDGFTVPASNACSEEEGLFDGGVGIDS